jgi:DNA-binding transcriptional LysR family regulator
VYKEVAAGTRDLGVTTVPENPNERIAIVPLFHEEFVLAVRSDHPVAKSKAIPFEQIEQLKMVMFGPEHQITKLIHDYCHEKGVLIDNPVVTNTLSTLLLLVDQGVGACILPRMLLDYLNRENITVITLLHPTPSQDVCILYRKDKYLGLTAKKFMEVLQSFIQNVSDRSSRSLG